MLGILLPSVVLLGLLWSTLSERHELALEKRALERSEAVQKLRRGVELEIAFIRSLPQSHLGPFDLPGRRMRWRDDGQLLPFESEHLQTQLQDDALLLESPAFFDAVREEQRGAWAIAVLHYRRALTAKSLEPRTATRIELALARALIRAGRNKQSLEALDAIAARELTPWEAWECARLRWRATGDGGSEAERQAALAGARAKLDRLRPDLGLLEYWTLRKPLGLEGGPKRWMELYRFLVAHRGSWARDPAAILIWEDAPEGPALVMLGDTGFEQPIEYPLLIVARTAILEAAFQREPGLLRRFEYTGPLSWGRSPLQASLASRTRSPTRPPAVEGRLDVHLASLGVWIGLREREPLPAAFWGDPAARVLFGLGCGMLLVLALGLWVSLRAVAKESRLSRMRADFISSVSHELKTPLTSLRLYSDLLAAPTVNGHKVAEYQERISEETRKLTHLVANVLDASRIERGREYQMEPVDLAELAQGALRAFEARAEAQGARMELVGCDQACPIAGDREALGQVLSNLLDNAIKHGGKEIHLELQRTADQIQLRVCDNGSGIARAQRARLFEPYERGTEHGPGQAPGSGLGLAIALDVMRAHEGASIDVEDRAQWGFCMLLCFRARQDRGGSEA